MTAVLFKAYTLLCFLSSGSSLEQIHVFALSHILRRPIVIYGIKYVKSFRGENLGLAKFQGKLSHHHWLTMLYGSTWVYYLACALQECTCHCCGSRASAGGPLWPLATPVATFVPSFQWRLTCMTIRAQVLMWTGRMSARLPSCLW